MNTRRIPCAFFLQAVLPYLQHQRCIRVDNRPLLLVYRPEDIPQCAEWANMWRDMTRLAGLPGLYLASVEALSMGNRAAGVRL